MKNEFRLLRHATLLLRINDLNILVDPMLSAKNAMEPVGNAANLCRFPMVDLPVDQKELKDLLNILDAVIVTHTHRDHWDVTAQQLINKEVPIISPSEHIIYCITTVFEILVHQLEFVYTNGHGVDELTDFFEPDTVANILNHIDKPAIDQKYWRNDSDLDLKRRKEAEFLVRNDIPVGAILGYAVYNLAAQQNLINFGINGDRVVIKPSYYF